MKFNYKFPLNELAIKPPKLRFCLAKYKFLCYKPKPKTSIIVVKKLKSVLFRSFLEDPLAFIDKNGD